MKLQFTLSLSFLLFCAIPAIGSAEWTSLGALSTVPKSSISPNCSYRFALEVGNSDNIQQRLTVSYVRVDPDFASLEADVGAIGDAFDGLRPATSACLKGRKSKNKTLNNLTDFKVKAVWTTEFSVLNVQCSFQKEEGAFANQVATSKLNGFYIEQNCS